MHYVTEWMRSRASHASRLRATEFLGHPPDQQVADLSRTAGRVLRKRIVIIMTDGCIINSVAQALEQAGYEIRSLRGLPGALEGIRRDRPSLVVACGLPDADTYRALREATGAPILALVTEATEADILDVLEAGADDCQPASIGNQEIVLRVRTLLRRNNQ